MNLNLDTNGFRSIANSFDLFFIDIWGVIHNGISIFEDSINVLDELDKLIDKIATSEEKLEILKRHFDDTIPF